MKKYFFLLLLMVGLMACSTAPPPAENSNAAVAELQSSETEQITLAAIVFDVTRYQEGHYNAGNSFANRFKNSQLTHADELDMNSNLYASLSTGYQDEPPNETIGEESPGFIKEHWLPLLIGLMAFFKLVVNLTPTEKDNKIFGWLDAIINSLIPNFKKGGGTHEATPS